MIYNNKFKNHIKEPFYRGHFHLWEMGQWEGQSLLF